MIDKVRQNSQLTKRRRGVRSHTSFMTSLLFRLKHIIGQLFILTFCNFTPNRIHCDARFNFFDN